MPQFAILTATFVGLAAINSVLYGLLADRLRRRIARPSVLAWITRTGGAALIAIGMATVAIRRSA